MKLQAVIVLGVVVLLSMMKKHKHVGVFHVAGRKSQILVRPGYQKFWKYFSENLSTSITHPPDTEIAKPADLYPPDNMERGLFHINRL